MNVLSTEFDQGKGTHAQVSCREVWFQIRLMKKASYTPEQSPLTFFCQRGYGCPAVVFSKQTNKKMCGQDLQVMGFT